MSKYHDQKLYGTDRLTPSIVAGTILPARWLDRTGNVRPEHREDLEAHKRQHREAMTDKAEFERHAHRRDERRVV